MTLSSKKTHPALATKRKRPWGAGAFLVVDLGVVGVFYISTRHLWGLIKSRVNSLKLLLSNHRCVGAGDRNRLAGLHDPRRLRLAVLETAASRDAKACHRDASNERHDHDLEVGRAIRAVDRMVHQGLPPPSCALTVGRTRQATGSTTRVSETWGFGFLFPRSDHKAVIILDRPRLIGCLKR